MDNKSYLLTKESITNISHSIFLLSEQLREVYEELSKSVAISDVLTEALDGMHTKQTAPVNEHLIHDTVVTIFEHGNKAHSMILSIREQLYDISKIISDDSMEGIINE